MAKYKVGDKVRIVSEQPASPRFVDSMVQYLGKTLTVSKVEEETLGAIYRFKEATYPASVSPIMEIFLPKTNGMWAFCEDWIAGLAEQKKPSDENISVKIHFHGRLTVAELYKDGKVVKVENARCNPKDAYDRGEGAKVAVNRLFEKKHPVNPAKEWNVGDKFRVVLCDSFTRNGDIVTLVEKNFGGINKYKDSSGRTHYLAPLRLVPYKETKK